MAPAVEHRAVAVLTLPDRVDLGLELGDLGVQVVERDLQRREPVVGLTVLRLGLFERCCSGRLLGSVFDPAQLGVELGQFEQRTLLD